jgi:hypothetical protein
MSSIRYNVRFDTSRHGPPHPFTDAAAVADSMTDIHKKNILSTSHKYAPPAVSHELNVPGHMLIWTLRLVSACGTRAQNLSAHFSYFLYIIDESFEVRQVLITQDYWVLFWTFPSSGILDIRKHDVSETGSVSVLR